MYTVMVNEARYILTSKSALSKAVKIRKKIKERQREKNMQRVKENADH